MSLCYAVIVLSLLYCCYYIVIILLYCYMVLIIILLYCYLFCTGVLVPYDNSFTKKSASACRIP